LCVERQTALLYLVVYYLDPAGGLHEGFDGIHEFRHVLETHASAHVVEVEPLEAELLAFSVDTAVLVECLCVLFVKFSNLRFCTVLVDEGVAVDFSVPRGQLVEVLLEGSGIRLERAPSGHLRFQAIGRL
jgi:hypothetical protein